jgi:polyisoprenyl-teichoic acid--peptidoglycan teichoic acid transferase
MTTWQERRQKQTQQRGSGGHWTRWMWWATGTTIALMTSATIGAIAAWMLPSATKPITQPFVRSQKTESTGFNFQLSRPIHILILGVDKPDVGADRFSGRSDTIVVMRFDPAEGTASLLSIPRDTQVELPEVGLAKINQANYNGGPEAAIAAVQQVLGEVSIDRYVRISTQALQELVDLVGGVEVFVPEPMSYTDRAGQLTIDLEAGWQVLNGVQAEQFSRYRQGGYGDIGRVQRQQELMKAMRSRLTNPAILPKLPEAMRMMRKHLDTNLSAAEIAALVQFSLNLGPDRPVSLARRAISIRVIGWWMPKNAIGWCRIIWIDPDSLPASDRVLNLGDRCRKIRLPTLYILSCKMPRLIQKSASVYKLI